ncbi:MAG: glycosyltransferase [Acidimicrobiales bacterium]
MSSGRSGSARWDVQLRADALTHHSWQVFAGLSALAARGEVDLRFVVADRGGLPLEDVVPWAEVHDRESRGRWTVCFDLADGVWLTGPRPRIADVVFKRSYQAEPEVAPGEQPGEIAGRVLPFGLNYACRTGHEGRMIRYSFETLRTAGRRGKSFRPTSWRLQRMLWPFRQPVQLARARRHPGRVWSGIPRHVSQFEVAPDVPAEPVVLFHTRAWAERVEGVADHHTGPNFQRAELIRTLQRRLGSRFRGGFAPSPYAREHFPDCLSDQPTEPVAYMRAVHRCAIAVSTIGLQRSTPYKLPENLSASRAIVSDPIHFGLPTPLVPGTHLLGFDDPDGCADACERLLDDPALVGHLRQQAWDYYQREVRPDVLLRNRLHDLLHLDDRPSRRPTIPSIVQPID